jgi:hypothetical protein
MVSAKIQKSNGAALDPVNIYSTTYSITHKNWSHQGEQNEQRLAQATGYTKNCSSFVSYDPVIDEKECKYFSLTVVTRRYDSKLCTLFFIQFQRLQRVEKLNLSEVQRLSILASLRLTNIEQQTRVPHLSWAGQKCTIVTIESMCFAQLKLINQKSNHLLARL